jgi:signal transduction histidine kinase/response regulator RpfG family c-di-GMP phosphodiesterase
MRAPAVQPRAGPFGEPAPLTAKVLIVDDDERNAFAAVQALETLGHELVVARSGEEALRKVLDEEFAVILLDLHMPGMDGYETAELLRQRRRTRDTPIVFLTAVFRDEAHLFQAYSAGAIDVVFKPVDPFILRSKVSLLVDLHLKTAALRREAENRLRLLDENARMHAEKLSAERKLRQSQERQEAILRSLPIVFHSRAIDPPFPALFVSDSVLGLTGFGPERFLEEPGFGLARIHPDDVPLVAEAHRKAREVGVYQCEYRWRCADGTYRSLLDQGVLAPADESGPSAIFGTLIDNTERRSLEEQLAQARKMEAVGQLTGGVAHDFNNLLTVVLGNVDLLSKPGITPRQKKQLDAVRQAAERGRSLTRQLLAFSRRQHLSPVVLEVNGLISTFTSLLRQAVGEAVTVQLELHADQLNAHVDPVQLESALLNLAVNARDAMPEGGVLRITTRYLEGAAAAARDLEPGEWIEIEVADTGTGMPPEVLERVFEPFFTTKEVGKGSGLGLSQVYGFVRQSGGHIQAESRPGQGTAFRLYLARSVEVAADLPASRAAAADVGGSETVLVVEDDPSVLALTVELLSGLGYRVLTAQNAAEALKVLKSKTSIDLLFSDVVMPGGVSGLQLGRQARDLRPGLQVLLTSGFMGQAADQSGAEFPLIDKPYERSVLAARLRQMLDAASEKPVEMDMAG